MIKNIKSAHIPDCSHGFFTNQHSNTSEYPLPLDFSYSTLQSPNTTKTNRRLAIKSLEEKEYKVFFINQVHSSKSLHIDTQSFQNPQTGDGIVTNKVGIGLAILTADCAPVLFFDPIARVIGAAHAGWRGALNGILENTVDAMLEIGATKDNIIASVGPCISQVNYEVDIPFKKKITKDHSLDGKFFFKKPNDKYLFDLSAYIEARLQNHGVKKISSIGICTYEKRNNFHSFRRAQHLGEASHQRNISIIKL